MKIIEAIQAALPVFADHQNSDWDVLEAALINAGIPPAMSTKILEFMPIAFGRAFFDGMGIAFRDIYLRHNSQNEQFKEFKLADEPIYTEALWAASEIIKRQAAGDAFMAVLFRSAEFKVVNNALNAGSEPQNLEMSPPVLLWDSNESTETESSAPPKKKWQFWK